MKCPNCNSEITLNSKSRIKIYGLAILLLLLVSGGLFYWYEWRPTQIRKECEVQAWAKVMENKKKNDGISIENAREVHDLYYKRFMRERGLEK